VTPRPQLITATPGREDAAIAAARDAIAAGDVIAFPTETFYGLGADPAREDAVAAIFAAKGRAAGESLPLIAADVAAARRVAAAWSDRAERLAAAFWPGPLTLVVPVRAGAVVPGVTAGRDTIAVRVPGHPLARALAAAAPDGLLTATSANRSGSPALASADAVVRALGAGIALVLDGGASPGGLASTIVDLTVVPNMILREGPVTLARVLDFV
jgi:L-threonylcarbamoyladenylate synthase